MDWKTEEEITEQIMFKSCKNRIREHVEILLDMGIFKPKIEIELCQYVKELLKEE